MENENKYSDYNFLLVQSSKTKSVFVYTPETWSSSFPYILGGDYLGLWKIKNKKL